MLDRTLSMQLRLTGIAVAIWLLYVGAQWILRRRTVATRTRGDWIARIFYGALTLYAVGHILFVGYAWYNRAAFPLNLETMELLKLQHVKRLLSGLPLYVAPSAEFIPLVYNPLYYYLVLPFTALFGVNLLALRIASIVAAVGAYGVVFLAVRQTAQTAVRTPDRPAKTPLAWLDRPTWWGLIAVGLMAAAFRVMDTYLDNAAADSWTLFTILLGVYLLGLQHSRAVNLLGILSLVAAFWLKQYGAIFTIGAVCYLTWRDGWRQSWVYWAVAFVGGPLLYLLTPPQWFGADFHYYTWDVPRQWMEFSVNSTILRVIKFIIKHYAWLMVSAGLLWLWLIWRRIATLTIWYFLLPFALLSGPYVALDPGNNNNVFIPLGAWLIVTGVMAICVAMTRLPRARRWGAPLFLLSASFALLAYNPLTVLIRPETQVVYQDLVTTIAQLDGVVYAPGVGQLQDRELFFPTAHWVTLIDLIRKPGVDLCDQPLTHELLEPVIHPVGPAYILLEHPLEEDAMLSFLSDSYVLEQDFGNRYIALRDSPKLLEVGWPTYLYRYQPTLRAQGVALCG
jgi:hypothetical protein